MTDFLTKEDYRKISSYWESKSDKDRIVHSNQIACADEIWSIFWDQSNKNKNSRVILNAQPQSGKTGVILRAIRDALYEWSGSEIGKSPLPMSEWQIIVFSCIPDNALRDQTKERIGEAFFFDKEIEKKLDRNKSIVIYHGKSLYKGVEKKDLQKHIERNFPKDIKRLIILDESHLNKNTINDKVPGLIELLNHLGVDLNSPVSGWSAKNGCIKLLEVSATAYAERIVEHAQNGVNRMFSRVLMNAGSGYYGIEEIKKDNRFKARPDIIKDKIFSYDDWKEIYEEYIKQVEMNGNGVCLLRVSSEEEGNEIKSKLEKIYKHEKPFVNIFSAKQGNIDTFDGLVKQSSLILDDFVKLPPSLISLLESMPENEKEDILKHYISYLNKGNIEEKNNLSVDEELFNYQKNCRLNGKSDYRIYFIIIDSFRAGKTFGKEMGQNIRCWVDGTARQNDTLIQSVGRCFGYGRSGETFPIYCDLDKIDDYIKFINDEVVSLHGNGTTELKKRESKGRYVIDTWKAIPEEEFDKLNTKEKMKISFSNILSELDVLLSLSEENKITLEVTKQTNSGFGKKGGDSSKKHHPARIVRRRTNWGLIDNDKKFSIKCMYLDSPNAHRIGKDSDWDFMENDLEMSNLLGKVCVPVLKINKKQDRKINYKTKKVSPYGDNYNTNNH